MPTVPRLTQNQVAPTPLRIAPREAAPSGLQALGGGIQDAAGQLFEVKQRESLLADQTAVTEADRQLGQTENALLFDPQNGAFTKQGKDAMGIGAATLQQYDQSTAKVAQTLTTPRAQRVFQEAAGKRRLDIERSLAQHEVQQREVYADNEAKAYIQESVNSAANNWGNAPRVAEELERQRAVIDQQASRKGWSPEQRDLALRAAQSDLHTGIVARMIGAHQFGKASEYLSANAQGMEDTAVESLQRRILVEEDGALRRQEHQQKLASDAMAKDGDKLFAQGQLNSEWIEAHRNTLDPQDYRYFYGKLTGNGEGPRDSDVYADLSERAGRGEDVRIDAREALHRGAIRASDWDRIRNEVEQERPGWYKRGTQYITTSAAVSDLNPDPAANQRLAAMREDWQDWAKQNPKATDTEAQTAYKRIVDEYAIIHLNNVTLTKRAPSFLVGTRTAPDMAATKVATVKAYKEGRISRTEFERQAVLLKEWGDALAHQVKPKAKSP